MVSGELADVGSVEGTLSGIGTLEGELSDMGQLTGDLTVPGVVLERNYERLRNKPSIESVTLIGNKDFPDLGLTSISADDLIEILT